MINHYVIAILRKGATKETVCSCTENNYLSLCQILESTDDVDSYRVGKIGKDFQFKDSYMAPMENMKNPWPKWKPVEVESGHNPNA